MNTFLDTANLEEIREAKSMGLLDGITTHLDDISHNGIETLRDIVTIYRNCGLRTQILAASIRHPIHAIEAAKAGADIAMMPYKVFSQLFDHPLTEKGQAKFRKHWEQVTEMVR